MFPGFPLLTGDLISFFMNQKPLDFCLHVFTCFFILPTLASQLLYAQLFLPTKGKPVPTDWLHIDESPCITLSPHQRFWWKTSLFKIQFSLERNNLLSASSGQFFFLVGEEGRPMCPILPITVQSLIPLSFNMSWCSVNSQHLDLCLTNGQH